MTARAPRAINVVRNMKLARTLQTAALIILALFAGGCAVFAPKTAAAPPAVLSPPPPAPKEAKPESPPVQQIKLEEAKTIIPAEERTSADPNHQTQEKDDATISIEDALTFYDEAIQARARGDLDAAIKSLDDAYGIIIRLDIAPDSPLNQERTTSAS